MQSLEIANTIHVVAVILSICPLLKSSTAPRHASSNSGLLHSPLLSAFSATDFIEAVLEDSPMCPGPVSLDIIPDSFLVGVIDDRSS